MTIAVDKGVLKRRMSALDFTLKKYEELCDVISRSTYRPVTLREYLRSGRDERGVAYAILRHDVDRTPRRALDTAEIEHRYNIRATYYFRARRGAYVPEIIDKIAAYDHEIGNHYETLDKAGGDVQKAQVIFAKELGDYRNRYDIRTVCAHGNPLTRYDNKTIWNGLAFSDFGLLGEAFLSLDYERFAYFSDSGRTWLNSRSQKMLGKDSVRTAFEHLKVKSTDDLIATVKEGALPNICILAHPERWTGGAVAFVGRYLLDAGFSCGKAAIYLYRKGR